MHARFTALLVAAAALVMSVRADTPVAVNAPSYDDARYEVLGNVLAHFRDHGVLTRGQYERGLAHGRRVNAHAANERWAVVTYLGGNGGRETHGYMYGVYSVKARMKALGMSPRVDQVVFYNHATPKKYVEVLEGWLGPENVIFTNMENDLPVSFKEGAKSHELWVGVFAKLVFFNLTRYDRLITLDNDVLIRQNIEHWFWDYPPPAATHARAEMEWNSGAMVIKPSKHVFQQLITHLNATRRWKRQYFTNITFADNWNSGIGQQGFLSAYFTHDDNPDRMSTMPYGNSILSSDLRLERNLYFWKFRNSRIETVHLTVDKPWRRVRGKLDPVICEVLWEWNRSVTGIEEYGLGPLRYDYLGDCPKTVWRGLQ